MRKFWKRDKSVLKSAEIKPMSMNEIRKHGAFKELSDTPRTMVHVRSPYRWVREFHAAFGMPVGHAPKHLTDERLELRWALIHEEYLEVSEAIDDAKTEPSQENLLALVKELADLVYVVEGFAVELGVDLEKVIAEVHRSNMTKLGEDGLPIYRADGKVLKGPNYEVADLHKVVFGD